MLEERLLRPQKMHPMKTVRIILDDDLIEAVDRVVRKLGTSRSAFTRDALREALARRRDRRLEQRHSASYVRSPVRRGEFGDWGREQV
jgi:metal-responsive CopG/Arc/MetJ family transcriptional regulator